MISTSQAYKQVLAGLHEFEWKVEINTATYYNKIVRSAPGDTTARITRQTFPNGNPSVGNCLSSEFSVALLEPSYNIPRLGSVRPYFRAVSITGETSEWIQAGEFYIDMRRYDEGTGVTYLTCYDAMLKTEGPGGNSYYDLTQISSWPASVSSVVSDIARIIGVTIDSRTSLQSGFMVDDPGNLTMREVLGNIAAEHCGNWIITAAGELRLVPLCGDDTATINLGESSENAEIMPSLPEWTKVSLAKDNTTTYTSGNDNGIALTAEDPWATQAKADYMLSVVRNISYQPFSASEAFVDPAAEIGDKITFISRSGTKSSHVWSIDLDCDEYTTSTVAAPGGDEFNHEYPYIPLTRRRFRRNMEELEESVDEKIEETKEEVTAEVLEEVEARIAGIVVDSIYADTGDIAELTVDELSTSRRAQKYILSDTSDDNYIRVKGQYIRLITGSVSSTAAVQATNRHGQALYWGAQPVSHTAEGYPLDASGNRIYASTVVTSWPVYTYSYAELTKTSLAFEQEDGDYVPMLVMGAGDNQGRTQGILHKAADGFDISFTDSGGNDLGLRMNTAGYMDLYGLRKPTELDFSGWGSGYFQETVDGEVSHAFLVDFDDQGRPIKITDGDGHETVVTW